MNRKCDSCTKCCDGWLTGEAYGYHFSPGKPCNFVGDSGCSIHETKPETPCKIFNCAWLIDESIPIDFKPNNCNLIITTNMCQEHNYIMVTQAGENYDQSAVDYFVNQFNSGKINNLIVNVDNKTLSYTTPIIKYI